MPDLLGRSVNAEFLLHSFSLSYRISVFVQIGSNPSQSVWKFQNVEQVYGVQANAIFLSRILFHERASVPIDYQDPTFTVWRGDFEGVRRKK